MSIRSQFLSKSVIDFIYMFSSNLIKKGFGFFREIILAAIFGSSIFYSNFLFLKTISELFSEFTQGSAMQAALLSKFSKLYSSNKDVSLKNIFKELQADLDKPIPTSGNLSSWARQGVLLLNATLTVREGEAGSHQNKGWEQFTDAVIDKVSKQKEHLVFLLSRLLLPQLFLLRLTLHLGVSI